MMRSALIASLLALEVAAPAAPVLSPEQQFARDVYRELLEINTVTATGDTLRAAQAMAARLRAAGFPEEEVHVFNPAPRKGNLVARLRGTGARRPILLVAHLDVIEAKPTDWSTDPFTPVEKDGWLYARGSTDDKAMAASFVAALVRYKREGFVPARDIVLVLETDEEILDENGLGMRWLLKNHRDLLDAEVALNEGGNVLYVKGKPVSLELQTSEKISTFFLLEVKNKGGHSSLPSRDNAIYRLADALGRIARFDFPVKLNETTRATLDRAVVREEPAIAADIRSILGSRPDPRAAERLSQVPRYNAMLRTTCVATLLEAGHAPNALPQVARATVNCRILPDESADEIQRTLVRVVADEQIAVTKTGGGNPSPPSPIDARLVRTIERVASDFWPGVPVGPVMVPATTDSLYLRTAGIPTYGHSGMRRDFEDNNRIHGMDERLSVDAFYKGSEYLYRLVKAVSENEPRSPPDSPTARRTVALVERAAALVDRQGKAAFAEFRKPGTEWFDGDTYLFAYDTKGNVLLNPAFPKREGTNVSGQKDVNGKAFHDELLKTAATAGSGWVDYAFPKPGQTQPSHKWTYVKRVTVDGVPGLVGSGFYAD
jgi:acetylornithine deacetylase/succinyl-diaminopimelate desuccinylase-like protein